MAAFVRSAIIMLLHAIGGGGGIPPSACLELMSGGVLELMVGGPLELMGE